MDRSVIPRTKKKCSAFYVHGEGSFELLCEGPSKEEIVSGLGNWVTQERFGEVIVTELTEEYYTIAECAGPSCSNIVLQGGVGRKRLYCSRKCRRATYEVEP